MKTILVVAGTRPEIIKVAPVILAAREKQHQNLTVKFCLTGQHQTMAKEAMSVFGIVPDLELDIMRPDQSLNDISQAVFERLPPLIDKVRPEVIAVQGDTTTAAISALCAFNQKIPVAHIEAGLRSFNLDAPYPEECNRRIIDSFAAYDFCPTASAAENLRRESVPDHRIYITGNTVVDAIHLIGREHCLDDLTSANANVKSPFVLITAHRRESFGQGFENICQAVRTCAMLFPGVQFVYPVHLNPNVQKPVYKLLGSLPNVLLISPVPYLPLLTLLKHCTLVLTDSGGIQEEAPSFGKYCVVMREVTERMESVQLGITELVGTEKEKIVAAVSKRLSSQSDKLPKENPYGDGRASERILDVLSQDLTR